MKKPTADDLIAEASAPRFGPPPEEAILELQKLIEYNATATTRRVSGEKAVALLRAYGWEGKTREDLNAVCRDHLGRHGWGKA